MFKDHKDDEDDCYEVDEKNDEFFRNLIRIEDDMVLVDFPQSEQMWKMKYESIRHLVEHPELIAMYSPNQEAIEFWQETLPVILDISREKIELYRNLGFARW